MQMILLVLVVGGMLALTSCSSPQLRSSNPASEASQLDLPGARGDGAVRLPNQWWLRPVGKQLPVGDFPVNIALHPSGKFAAILHCGYGQHEIIVVDVAAWKIVSRA